MSRAEQLKQETKEKAEFIKQCLSDGLTLKEIEKQAKKYEIKIGGDAFLFLKAHSEHFKNVSFKKRKI